MKRFGLVIGLLALLSAGLFAQEKERIAIFPFEDMNSVLTPHEAIFFYREFSNEFTNKSAGRFTIVPRQEVDKLINTEKTFQLTDLSSKVKTAEYERVLNGTQILSGLIGKVSNNIRITVSLYTYPELALLPGGATLSVSNTTELFNKIPELVQNMLNAIAGRTISGNQLNNQNNFVFVEGGTFTMGSPNNELGRLSYEGPQSQVTVSSFYMSIYEITQKEWREVMGKLPAHYDDIGSGRGGGIEIDTIGDNFPIRVDWYDAIEYCNKRSIREGLTPAYRGASDNIICDWNANGYRLPTEAEWEYAAKGGNKDHLIFRYSGSNNPDVVAWHKDSREKRLLYEMWGQIKSIMVIQPVGTKASNSLGIYDMSGNVSEWCWDWAGIYTRTAKTNPTGPTEMGNVVIAYNDKGEQMGHMWGRINRGGDIFRTINGIRSSRRGSSGPGYDYHGIRIVRRQ